MPGRDRTGRLLPAKDNRSPPRIPGERSGSGSRIQGIPGLVLVVQRPGGTAGRLVFGGSTTPSPAATPALYARCAWAVPTIGLAEARRKAAELMEAVERALTRSPSKGRHMRERITTALHFDLVADYLGDQRSAGVRTVDEIERALRVTHCQARRCASGFDNGRTNRGRDRCCCRSGQASMARHLLAYLRGCFNHALRGSPALRQKYGLWSNPADTVGGGRRGKAGKYGRPTVDDRHLIDAEMPRSGKRSKQAEQMSRRSRARVLLLTGQRPREVRCTRISELSLDGPEPQWTMPGTRTKNGDPHVVPLVQTTVMLFRRAAELSNGSPLAFPSSSTSDGILGKYTIHQAVERLFTNQGLRIEPFSPKDLRSRSRLGWPASASQKRSAMRSRTTNPRASVTEPTLPRLRQGKATSPPAVDEPRQ